MQKQKTKPALLEFQPRTTLTILCRGHVRSIQFADIIYISRCVSHSVLLTAEGNYSTPYSLAELLNDLPVNDFFRVHKSHIVSLRHIQAIHGNSLTVAGQTLPFTDYYKKQMTLDIARQLGRLAEFFFFRM